MDDKEQRIQEEYAWIDAHPVFYRDQKHMEDVKHNIRVGYDIREFVGAFNALPNGNRAKGKKEFEEKLAEMKAQRRHIPIEYCTIKVPPIPEPLDVRGP